MLRFRARILGFRRNQRGAAAAEFAILLVLLVIPLLNAIDLGIYAYDYMELRHAAQSAAQAVWARCAYPKEFVPAAVSCSGYTTDATNTAYGTPLQTNVSVSFGGYFAASTALNGMTTPGEGFACLEGGVLTSTKDQPPNYDEITATSDETNCTGSAHDYIMIKATDPNYAPIFPQLSFATLLPSPTTLVTMRLD